MVSAAPAERNWEEMVRAVMAVTAVAGSPDQEELEETVQPEEPVTILAEESIATMAAAMVAVATMVVAAAVTIAIAQAAGKATKENMAAALVVAAAV